ncbi:hypothetical protein CAGA_20820 [Caproiciproducens galactitolivorans]|uniref:Uncharacterized protein n=1 Tax=Caproiciproducens galactitolivorans TaxID=642589 RepID=A0A4Z0XWW2_9FIRM|nr:hypothetical protein CAGA_20820 [Caproiciproducens galactitolivorans]
MGGLFGFLSFAAFVAFIVGMVKPQIVVFWAQKKSRGPACLYLAATVIFSIIAGIAGGGAPVAPAATSAPSSVSSRVVSAASPAPESTAPISSAAPVSSAPEAKSYPAGMYKIGSDLPAGEYVLISDGISYFQIAKDSTGELGSIIANDNFSGQSIVTVNAGQYLTLNGATAYAIADAPSVEVSSGKLPDGMYKVGRDIKPGEYKVHATNSTAYIEVAKNSTHTLDAIVSNDNFTGDKYITIKDGQYIKLSGAELTLG